MWLAALVLQQTWLSSDVRRPHVRRCPQCGGSAVHKFSAPGSRVIGLLVACVFVLGVAAAAGQARQRTTALSGVPALDPPAEPVVLYSQDQPRIRVVPITTGLSHPWGLAFRRNGDILVTERNAGTLRLIRDGVLDPRPIPGVPEVYTGARLAGLMDIALHPDDDRLVYLTYSKPAEQDGRRGAVIALARGRLDSGALTEVRDVFVSEGFGRGVAASRVTFGPDGKVYMTIGGAIRSADDRAAGPGSGGARRQGPATERGRHGAGRQPVRRRARLPARDLLDGPPEPARPDLPPRERHALGERERPAGRRRGQRHPPRPQLRLADRLRRPGVHRGARVGHALARGFRAAGDPVVAVDRTLGPDVL